MHGATIKIVQGCLHTAIVICPLFL